MAFSGQEVPKFSSFEVKETCSDSEKSDSDLYSEWDDSEEDPDYDILEDTHGKLSNLSIDKKKKGRVTEGKDPMTEADPEEREITAAALDEKDEENFDQVQKTIEEKRVFFRYCLLEVDSCIHVLKNFSPKPFCNAEAETSNIRNDSRIRVLKNSSPKPFCNAEAETTGLIEKLKVDQCKLYLRKSGLRLTGNKDVLVQRIKEHVEIMNGGGKTKYPPSSFVLNCKGDACTGDVVLFEQNVYEMFNLASRSASGPPCGKRTVAGRIVKESYGAAKQQHTFTIEVLWSKGEKPLPPLHPLLIKGRNLYRLKTLRQRWDDEGERQKILTEKHTRGSVARADREARIQEKEKKKTILKNRVNSRSQSHQTHSNKAKSQYDQPQESDQLINSAKPAIPSQTSDLLNLKKRPSKVQLPGSSAIAAFAGKPAAAGTQQCVKTADTKRMAMGPQLIGKSFDSVKPSFPGQKPVLSFDRTEVETESYQQKIYHWQKRQPSQNPYYDTRRAELSEKYIWPNINSRETQATFGRDSNSNGFAGMTHHRHRQPFTSTNHLLPLKPRRTQNQLCRHYAKGRCNYGENCKFLHDLRDQIIVFGETERIGGCQPHYPLC